MKTYTGERSFPWWKVLLFAAVTGVYTGAVMLFPALKDSSFQDIGISYECWIVFAVWVVTGCRRPLEAACKCFVFFLISQPLVYLTEVVFGSLSVEMACHYYFRIWLPMTMLTLPGGFIAWYCKKQTVFGGIVLGIANGMELLLGIVYALCVYRDFPHHLLTALFCFASVPAMTLLLQRTKKSRTAAFLTPLVLAAAALLFLKLTGRVLI